uniref:Retrovirus-related Pol polyprotein from transposon TNT 1-94 n=1 Tax=Cajanus cajan TaxID=3821 RepID=A0A151TU23_CAJCA|nr:Retrovirus-related Pol polyprotein from transposon TNT 1-94 [Cajanus cajan]
MIGFAEEVDGLYYLIKTCQKPTTNTSQINTSSTHNSTYSPNALWHFRLGHISESRLNMLSELYSFINNCNHKHVCDVCHFAKQRKLPFSVSNSKTSRPFELLHLDLWGPYSIQTVNHQRYFLTIVDDYSRYTWVILLKNKSQTEQSLRHFSKLVDRQFHSKIKTIRTDNGPEFFLHSFYQEEGIIHQTSCVETPQQNGRVERRHQTILNVARALLFQGNLPKSFWGFAVTHVVHLINKVPTQVLGSKSPYQILYGELPDLKHLRVFGCLCYISSISLHRKKFDSRAHK